MSTSTGVPELPIGPQVRQPQLVSLGWALRRAALGLLVLLVAVALGAWLLYASIDPDEAAAGPAAQKASSVPQR